MRFLIGFVVALVAGPMSAAAQGEEPVQEEPALRLELEEEGLGITPWTDDRYRRAYLEPRITRARGGLIAMASITLVGGAVLGAGVAVNTREGGWEGVGAIAAGSALAIAGGIGAIVSGALLGARKRQLRQFDDAHPRRAYWDRQRLRLGF